MENTSDSFMPRPLLFCLKSGRSVCYSVPDNNIFIRRYWYMDPIKKIADRHACGESKIKSILARSRKKLYGLLKEAGYEGE